MAIKKERKYYLLWVDLSGKPLANAYSHHISDVRKIRAGWKKDAKTLGLDNTSILEYQKKKVVLVEEITNLGVEITDIPQDGAPF